MPKFKNFHPKSIQDVCQIAAKGASNLHCFLIHFCIDRWLQQCSKMTLGPFLGCSWGALGVSRASWAALGLSWGAPWALLGRSWELVVPSWVAQYHGNIENQCFSMVFQGFQVSGLPNSLQHRPKIVPKRLLDTRLAPRGCQK